MKQTLQDFKAGLFKALAHPTRIRILERLRAGEKTVTMLQAELAVEANVLSQQLAVLRAQNVVEGRKQGTSVFYRVSDSTMFVLLDAARAIFDNRLIILREMADDDRPRQDEQAPQAMEAPSAV